MQALLPLLKDPKHFSADDVKNLLSNKDIKKALMDKVQENLPDGIDLSQAEEILSSKEVQDFLPLLSNPKDIRLDDFIKLLENDKDQNDAVLSGRRLFTFGMEYSKD